MSKITACKILNKSNESDTEELTICTEWSDTKIKIFILKSDKSILVGETLLEDFSKYARTFDKTLETYIKETENILSGKSEDIEFHLKENKFFWKKKKWALGQIIVKTIPEAGCCSDVMLLLINHYANTTNTASELQKFQNMYFKLCNKVDEIIASKLQMESDIYKQTILIINSKKAKIRELKSELEKLKGNENQIFDASTDESENECNPKDNVSSNSNIRSESTNKRTLIEESGNCKPFKRKCNLADKLKDEVKNVEKNVESNVKIQEAVQSIPSTSKSSSNTRIGADEETPDDFLSDESECEFELKFEEDQIENDNKNEESAIDEESEEIF